MSFLLFDLFFAIFVDLRMINREIEKMYSQRFEN